MATTAETTVTDDTSENADTPVLSITVEFTGGLEMLFADQRRHALSVPAIDESNKPVTVAYLIEYLCENTMKDTRKELFVLDDHLPFTGSPIEEQTCESLNRLTWRLYRRPGILVLINDADWELEGEEAYEVQNGDNILFVSTLHGG